MVNTNFCRISHHFKIVGLSFNFETASTTDSPGELIWIVWSICCLLYLAQTAELQDPCSAAYQPLVLNDYNGTISSKFFPDFYPVACECSWLITSPDAQGVCRNILLCCFPFECVAKVSMSTKFKPLKSDQTQSDQTALVCDQIEIA